MQSELAIHLYADALLVTGAGERPPVSDYSQLSRGDSGALEHGLFESFPGLSGLIA